MNEIVSLDKLLQIKCLSDESFEYVTNAIDSYDEDIREQAFTKLMMFSSNYDLLNLIKKGVEDESPLICSDCLEYLYELDSVEAERVIIDKLFEPNKVISCTALELIVRYPLREQTLNLLVKSVDEKSISSSERIRVLYALYSWGNDYSFDMFSSFIETSTDYRDRCAILNMLIENMRESDKDEALVMIENLRKSEPFESVLELASELDKRIKSV